MRLSLSPDARRPRVPVLRLEGMIAPRPRAGRAISHSAVSDMIERAFRRGRPAAVALVINSPGGSPAQSAMIARHIRRLAEETSIPVHAFVEDAAASGGYYIASAADHIWVDDSSIVGSIGVVSAGFGFADLIARHGIERRVHTAGRAKAMLDPFRPERPRDVARLEAIQSQVHQGFISHVKARRGARLRPDREPLFEGDVWVGEQAVALGLADGVAHLRPKMQDLFGRRVRLRVHSPQGGLWQWLNGARLADGVAEVLEERLLWQRFGL